MQVLVKEMSKFAVLCARPVWADGNCCIAHFTVHAQGVPSRSRLREIACASSECDERIARRTLDFGL